MHTFQRNVLDSVVQGDWVISQIQPLFFKTLLSKENVAPGFQIPLKAFENIELRVSGGIKSFSKDDFRSFSDFKKMCMLMSEEGHGGDFSNEEFIQTKKSLDFFENHFPEEAKLFNVVFDGFFRIREGKFSGSSNPRAWGIYFLGDRFFNLSEEQKAISFVHEMAHQELFLINLIDRLANKEAQNSLIFAPLQGRPRPPMKRLHSLWALFRMYQFARTYGLECQKIQSNLEENMNAFLTDELTQYGNQLVISVKECLNLQFV